MSQNILPAVIHLASIQAGPGWSTPLKKHSHPFYEIIIVLSGSLKIKTEGRLFQAIPGDVICYAPSQVHYEWVDAKKQCEFIFINFQADRFENVQMMTRDSSGRIRMQARWLVEENLTAYAQNKSGMNSMLQCIIYEINKAHAWQPLEPLFKVRKYLQEKPGEEHSLDDLAHIAGMSKFNLIRQYKRLMGISPIKDLMRLRIEKAVSLLLTTDQPLKAIALQTGFHEPAYFYRVFKQVKQTTPGRFRAIKFY